LTANSLYGSLPNLTHWFALTPEQRRNQRAPRPPWWALPIQNTLDRATAMLPKLMYQRLDEMGMDFSVIYPTLGLFAPHVEDEELRRAACRAFNRFHAEIFGEFADRIAPVAMIPMHTPAEAIDELEYAVKPLGMKAVMMGRSRDSHTAGSRRSAAGNPPLRVVVR
jgi:predicted TIM-barrel fold metal-dependent hydrolase